MLEKFFNKKFGIAKHGAHWKQGALDAVPISLSFILFGGVFGMMALQTGLSGWHAVLMSAVVYAGSSQFTSLSMISGQTDLWTIIFAVFLVNSRHLLMGLSLSPYFTKFSRTFINFIGFFLSDEQYAITLNRFRHHEPNKHYIMAVSLTLYIAWVTGTWLGTMAGRLIPDPDSLGLGFSFTAMFLALVYYQLISMVRIAVFFLCGAIAIGLALLAPGGFHLLAAGLIAFGIGYALAAKPHTAKRESTKEEAEEAV